MIRYNTLRIWTLCLIFSISAEVWGQFGDGGGFGSRMLRRLDRDENGSLDPDELAQAGPLKEYLDRHNIDTSQPIALGTVADYQAEMFQEMRERGDFQGGPGGPQGGPPGGPPADFSPRGGGFRGSEQRGGDSGGRGERRSWRGGRRDETGATPGAPGSPNAGAAAKPKVRLGRTGPKIAMPTLPAQYASRDINQDGQVGMYEWSRTDLSTFRKLDLNGDGFLTPAELVSPRAGTGGSVTTSTASTTSSNSSGGSRPATPNAPPANQPPVDLKTVAAEGAFVPLDANKDGQLSEEEWNRSRYAKKLFTDAKVSIQFPMPKATFVETYKKLAP